jgi:hypothetical protein
MDGQTPASTPPTTTREAFYFIPYIEDGVIGYGDESWPVFNHVTHCPIEVGRANGWAGATTEQVEAARESAQKSQMSDAEKAEIAQREAEEAQRKAAAEAEEAQRKAAAEAALAAAMAAAAAGKQ